MNAELVDAIDALLPQTQCTKCGFAGCRPYAEAIAGGTAGINQCPPGGVEGIGRLAALLHRDPMPLNPANGTETTRAAAVIDESRCIGCMLCIHACPTDAIVGAAKLMHTVLTRYCTGCDLCLPPCPVDCIEMVDLGRLAASGNADAARLQRETVPQMAVLARARQHDRRSRLERHAEERAARLAGKARAQLAELDAQPSGHDVERKKAAIVAALERARARRASSRP